MHVSYRYTRNEKRPSFRRKEIPVIRYTKNSAPARRKKIGVLLVGGFFASIIFLIAALAWISRDLPDPNKLLERAIPLSTKIYDRTGEHLLYEIHGEEKRTLVALKEIPDTLKWATIVAEDRDFYRHKGFDVKGIIRAIVVDILKRGKAQGGSTITQQFIKNALLTSKKSFARKAKELVLAYQLEKRFSKDQILQMYFNEIPYGSTAYGAQSASMLYFGKDVRTLSLSQSATLAALPKAPSYYSPWGPNRDKLIARAHRILDDMVSEGYIPQEEADDAKKEPLGFRESGRALLAPHFVLFVKELLTETYGEKLVSQGGLKVITTLDFEKQKIAEETIAKLAQKNLTSGAKNASLVSLDARTGEILALVGSRDYFDEAIDGSVNVALRKRQPGSSFKPIVYATAFSRGFTPSTIIFDLVTNFDTSLDAQKAYTPHNYTGKEYGPVSMAQALAGSLNIASVKTLYLAGVPQVIELAKKLGYTSLGDPNMYGLALVLGGGEVTLLEHTAAFTAFAQEGKVVSPVSLLRVENKHGGVIEETKKQEVRHVLDQEVARMINSILSDQKMREYIFGVRNFLSLPERPSAVKTGTTNDFRDAWTIGYTPSFVTGVWVGNNDNSAMKKGADGSKLAAPIWKEYMGRALKGTNVEFFTPPQTFLTGKDVLDGKIGKETRVKIDSATGFDTTDATPQENITEKTFRTIHSILYYVDKENPRGPEPDHPENDPQFLVWEKGVRAWVEKTKILEEEAPQAVDLIHTKENIPTLTILSPQENDTITSSPLVVTIQTQAPRGIAKVEYSLDNQLIHVAIEKPFSLRAPLIGAENGFRTLTVKSSDDVGNSQSASITLNFLLQKK